MPAAPQQPPGATVQNGGFGSLKHLVVRFFGALDPRGPAPVEEQWARDQLTPGEVSLWAQMSGPDRRHAIGVARDTQGLLGGGPVEREVLAAALLHDVGKIQSGFGTFSRVAVTVVAMAVGRARLVAPIPPSRFGFKLRVRVREYLVHDRLGADMLRSAGSHPLTVSWAEEHHLPPERWNVELPVALALKEADGD